jgi:hypothetical protein
MKMTSKVPKIYCYTYKDYEEKNQYKVGYTTEDDVKRYIKKSIQGKNTEGWYKTQNVKVVFIGNAIKENGRYFKDYEVHSFLENEKIDKIDSQHEWFDFTGFDVKISLENAMDKIKSGEENKEPTRDKDFEPRPEQQEAIYKTANYFKNGGDKYLWNAKMRFGKTFTTYKLIEECDYKNILILTYKPAVLDSWEQDLKTHKDFEGWNFKTEKSNNSLNDNKNIYFCSYQKILNKDYDNLSETEIKNFLYNIKEKNKWIFETKFDLLVIDETHYGAFTSNAQEIFDNIKKDKILYLSGTPYKLLDDDVFNNEQIFSWSYTDEQRAKRNWNDTKGKNPYLELPKMEWFAYHLPEDIQKKFIEDGDFNLNKVFEVENNNFKYHDIVSFIVDFLAGRKRFKNYGKEFDYANNIYNEESLSDDIERNPFLDKKLGADLLHTMWVMSGVKECKAMEELLKHHDFFKDFEIVNIGGEGGSGTKPLKLVQKAISKHNKSITITIRKLTAGVTIPQLNGVIMLNNMQSAEQFFQTIFRAQSPNKDNDGEILKDVCYTIDFNPLRTFTNVYEYITKNCNGDEKDLKDIFEYIDLHLYENGEMKSVILDNILNYISEKESDKTLSDKFRNNKNIDIDITTICKIGDTAILKIINSIPDYIKSKRQSNNIDEEEFKDAIKKSSELRELKKKKDKESNKIIDEETKKKRELIEHVRNKITILISSLAHFMYITQHREGTLLDIVENQEPNLFKTICYIDKSQFKLLYDAKIFNEILLNDSIKKFKNNEDISLDYKKMLKV